MEQRFAEIKCEKFVKEGSDRFPWFSKGFFVIFSTMASNFSLGLGHNQAKMGCSWKSGISSTPSHNLIP